MAPRKTRVEKKSDPLKALKNRVFVSSLEVQNPLGKRKGKFNVKLIGLGRHGTGWIPLGLRTRRIVKGELAGENGLILAEQKSRNFVPGKFRKKATGLEKEFNPVISFLYGQIPIHRLMALVAKERAGASLNYLKELAVKVQKVEGLAPKIPGKSEMLRDKDMQKIARILKVSPEQLYNGFRLLSTGRSLLLASQTLKELGYSKKGTETASVVVGAGHMEEMQKFLSNPRRALRTTRTIISVLGEINGTGEIRWALHNAEWAFGEQLKAQEKSG